MPSQYSRLVHALRSLHLHGAMPKAAPACCQPAETILRNDRSSSPPERYPHRELIADVEIRHPAGTRRFDAPMRYAALQRNDLPQLQKQLDLQAALSTSLFHRWSRQSLDNRG